MNKIYQLPTTNYQLTGKVIRGDGYGRKLGFPTANIHRRQYVKDKLKVKLGIWAGAVSYQSSINNYQSRPAAIVIGPVDRRGLPKLEAHLIGFKGNLYGKKLSIYLGIYLRPFKKFKSELELIEQIHRDIKNILNLKKKIWQS